MNRKEEKAVKVIQAMEKSNQIKAIQAMGIEGVNLNMALDNLIDGQPIYGINGTSTQYLKYSSQTTEIYKKYIGESEYGNDQVRAAIDSRTSFIAGEGMSIALGEKATEKHGDFFEAFIEDNKLNSTKLMDITRITEMNGYAITSVLKANIKKENRIPFLGLLQTNGGAAYYSPILSPELFSENIIGIQKGKDADKVPVNLKNFTYIRTGGYGNLSATPTTKVGIILTEAENYDRALRDMRELNHKCARITPTWKTKNKAETDQLTTWLKVNTWKLGDGFVGTADFSFQGVNSGALENLKTEMIANLKTVSSVTGIPVHWLGWVDQMANRATAQELYSMISNATIAERSAIEAALKEILIIAQQVYIDEGGDLISEVTEDFKVKLPLIDLGKFESTIKAYSMLYADNIISEETYRNVVPGINPIKEKALVDKELESEPVTKSVIPEDEEENTEENEDE